MYLTPALRQSIEKEISATILKISPLGGGDINIAGLLETSKGKFFIKINDTPSAAEMLRTEAKGLEILSNSKTIPIAGVVAMGNTHSKAWLLLNFIPSGNRTGRFWENFGTCLANLHRQSHTYFGLDHSNYIGSLLQYNDQQLDWIDFYINQRLLPQLKMAVDTDLLKNTDVDNFNLLFYKLPELIPLEPPALIHGDLWGGNFICSESEQGVLIDPAVSFANREMDLAMSRLFGGFAPRFYSAYLESYPTAPNLETRIGVYQIYYLLVHVNIFGGGYVQQLRSALSQYV
jgi:fructosamine-3-kinase